MMSMREMCLNGRRLFLLFTRKTRIQPILWISWGLLKSVFPEKKIESYRCLPHNCRNYSKGKLVPYGDIDLLINFVIVNLLVQPTVEVDAYKYINQVCRQAAEDFPSVTKSVKRVMIAGAFAWRKCERFSLLIYMQCYWCVYHNTMHAASSSERLIYHHDSC